ncbi:M60 family metallopeptidase [Chitinophaga caeni]|nr:M60 family metallopeptidase [Chitinophaga caeni]
MKSFTIKSLLGAAFLAIAITACDKEYNFKDGYDEPPKVDTAGLSRLDTNMLIIDSSGFPDAKKFPGLVPVVEPRLMEQAVTLDFYYKVPTDQIRISVVPGNWLSTGFYAAPGELVKVVVPDNVDGASIQIGAHTDNVSAKYPLLRAGVIYTRKLLVPGVNYIRNIYGGNIYILPSKPSDKKVTFTFSNVCKSPDFVLGETSDSEWKELLRRSNVPVFEMRSKRVVFTFYRKVMLSLLDKFNAEEVMKLWDEAIEKDYNEWYGLSDEPADIIDQAPTTQHRFVLDIQISLGSGHSGYPCMAYLDWHDTFIDTALIRDGASWGAFHEFGHNFQMGSIWSWGGADGLGETSNNLFVFKIANRYGRKPRRIYQEDFVQPALDWAAQAVGSRRFSEVKDVFQRLVPFVQLFQRYGYGMMTYIASEGRREPRPFLINEAKKNFFFVKASEYAQTNLKPFFDHWGIVVSPSAVDEVSHLPLLDEELWTNDIR